MLRTNNRRLSRRTHSFEKATPNPMENLANLVDVMLVFACALMIAIITRWNVDLTQSKISKEDLEPVDDMQEAIQNEIDAVDCHRSISKGHASFLILSHLSKDVYLFHHFQRFSSFRCGSIPLRLYLCQIR